MHMNHLVKGSICHILAQGSKSGRLRFCFETLFASVAGNATGWRCHTYRTCGSFVCCLCRLSSRGGPASDKWGCQRRGTPVDLCCGDHPQALGSAPDGQAARSTTTQVGTMHGCHLWQMLGPARWVQVPMAGTMDATAGVGGKWHHPIRGLGGPGSLGHQAGLRPGGSVWQWAIS